MAVDTALKRFSMMDFDVPSAPALYPTGADTFGERLHGLWLYAGIEPDGAPAPAAIVEQPYFLVSVGQLMNN